MLRGLEEVAVAQRLAEPQGLRLGEDSAGERGHLPLEHELEPDDVYLLAADGDRVVRVVEPVVAPVLLYGVANRAGEEPEGVRDLLPGDALVLARELSTNSLRAAGAMPLENER